MTSQRPKRQTKKPSRLSQSPSFVPPESQLSAIPEVRRPQKRPLQAIPVEPIPDDLAQSLPSKQRSILIWKTTHLELDLSSTRLHWQFQEGLIQALLDIPEGHTTVALPGHF